MAPSRQSSVSPSSNTLTAQVRQWIPGNHKDLYTYGLSECNVVATWTSAGITTLMHVTGQDVNACVTNLANHIHNTPGTIYVIAVAGPDNATETWFVNNWYKSLIKDPVLAKPVLTAADKARIVWVAPDFSLLKNVAPALRGTFALLENGRYGPSNAPPPPSRPATSSSSSSDSSFGNKGPLTSARPSQSPARGGSPARPSSSGSAGSGRGAPAAGGKTAAPAKKVVAAPVKKR